MNKIVLYLFAIILLSCNNSIEKIEDSHPNGNIKKIGKYLYQDTDTLKVYEKEFFEDGESIKMEGAIENDKREGKWVSYFENGKLCSKGEFKDGESHGESVVYYESGEVRQKGMYKNGKAVGEWVFFNEEGDKIKMINLDK